MPGLNLVYTSKAVNVHQFSGASSLNQIGLILRRSSFSKFDSFSLCASVHRCVILDTRRKMPRIFLHIDPISIKNFISNDFDVKHRHRIF